MDGQRLGQALTVNRAELDASEQCCSQHEPKLYPLVVTLAVCDSGRTSSDVAKPGSSVGFHIHEARIPFVVCSQFPLSHDGSVFLLKAYTVGYSMASILAFAFGRRGGNFFRCSKNVELTRTRETLPAIALVADMTGHRSSLSQLFPRT